MAIGTTNFPTSLDTATELIRAANDARGFIAIGGATNSAITINITSVPSSAPSDGIAVIVSATDDSIREIVSFTGKTDTSITGVTRNLEGSGAKTWAAGDIVYFDVLTALSRTVLVNAILALEAKVRPGEVLWISQLADRTGSNVNTAQKIFDSSANGAATVAGDTTYELEAVLRIQTTGTTSHRISVLFGGTATLASIAYKLSEGLSTGGIGGGEGSLWVTAATASGQVNAPTATASYHYLTIKGLVRVDVGGTFVPQFQWSAAPGGVTTVMANSYFKLTPVGNDTIVTLGTWS